MRLSLIGMSNSGKTFWSKRLAEVGFQHINCDDLIEAKLEPELKALGYSGLADMSRWLGQPYDERFAKNQQTYLDLETQVMQEIINSLQTEAQTNLVIDTTGSVIHTNPQICEALQRNTIVVYLETPAEMKEVMFQNYIQHPKPVVFGKLYSPEPGESQQASLERCYRNLLDYRSALYKKYTHVTMIGPHTHELSTDQFLDRIRQAS